MSNASAVTDYDQRLCTDWCTRQRETEEEEIFRDLGRFRVKRLGTDAQGVDGGLGTPSRYLAESISWNALKIFKYHHHYYYHHSYYCYCYRWWCRQQVGWEA